MAYPPARFFFPLLLFVFSWGIALSDNGTTLVSFATLTLPMNALAAYLLLVPGQLRSDGEVLAYRRWFRWETLPTDDVEEIRSFLVLGTVKLTSRAKRLVFYVEPENERFLGFKRGGEDSLQSRINPPPAREWPPPHLALDLLAGAAGLALIILLPGQDDGGHDPWWIARLVDFEKRFSAPLAALLIAAAVQKIRKKEAMGFERLFMDFCIGVLIVMLFRGLTFLVRGS
jgi:hypothetical protein